MKKYTSCYLLLIALVVFALRAAAAPSSLASLGNGTTDAAAIQQEYKTLTTRLIAEYLESGALSRQSVEAYQLLVGIARNAGVRVEKVPLRLPDERNLGPSLIVARLEANGLGYDRSYRLKLQNQ